MGAKKQTVGYRYFMSMLSGLCRGPIDELCEITAGDESAWTGNAADDSLQSINKPNLFGGDKKEGGIQGPFRVYMGHPTQVLKNAEGGLPSVKAAIGGRVSEMRGVVTVWYDGMISAMNPYIKEWKFRVRRSNKGWFGGVPWYPEKARIGLADGTIRAMNGTHIIYECCTNPEWGRGLPAARLNENSFIYAANRLCSENFGLCIAWYRKEDIDIFIQKVCDLIGAVLYTDRETGLITIKLIRSDYVSADLPLFTPETGLLDVREDDTGSSDNAFNEIIGTGRDPITNQDFQIRAQNLAAFQSQQSVSSLDQDYRGIPTKELLARVVLRDLQANAVGLKKFTVVLDRRAWRIAPGMPFRISDPKRGIQNIVVRAGEIDDGNMIDGRITIKTIQDVFGLPDTTYIAPADNTWTPPSKVALPAEEERLIEASYRDLYLKRGAAEAEATPDDEGYVGTLALPPGPTSYQYDLATRADGEANYEDRGTGSFTGFARLGADITAIQTVLPVSEFKSFDQANVGQALLIGDEIVRLEQVTADTITVARGAADTVPASHVLGTRGWTVDDDLASDDRSYSSGETAYAKVLTLTASDKLALDDATELSIIVSGRQGRPYPPANVRVDGTSIYQVRGEAPEPVITWDSRNRLTQGDHLVGYFEASIAPESGTTYTLRVINPEDDSLIRETTGLLDLTWTYDAAMQETDNPPRTVRIELESERDGMASWQLNSFLVRLKSGYGFNYGFSYGQV